MFTFLGVKIPASAFSSGLIGNSEVKVLTRTKTRRLNRNAPKAKTHKPKKGKGAYVRIKAILKNFFRGLK